MENKLNKILILFFLSILISNLTFSSEKVKKFPKPKWNRNYKINIVNSRIDTKNKLYESLPKKVNVYKMSYPKITRNWIMKFAKDKFSLNNLKYSESASGLLFYVKNENYSVEIDKFGIGYLINNEYTNNAKWRFEPFSLDLKKLEEESLKIVKKFGINKNEYECIGVKDEREAREVYTVRFKRVLNGIECEYDRLDISFGNNFRLATVFFSWRDLILVREFVPIKSFEAFNLLKTNSESVYSPIQCIPGNVKSCKVIYEFLPIGQEYIIPFYKFNFEPPKKHPYINIFGYFPAISNDNFE